MSAISTTSPSSAPQDITWVRRNALIAGIGGIVLSGLGALYNPDQFFHAYLIAFVYILGLGTGSLFLLMLQHMVGGSWGLVLRRFLEAGTRTLPLLALFAIPVLFGLRSIYPWTDEKEALELGTKAEYYLNVPFFITRLALYFGIWLILSFFLNLLSRREDETGEENLPLRFRMISGPGIVLFALTMSFAGIDLGMSLTPHWFSTMYPPLWAFGNIVTAYAFMVFTMSRFSHINPLHQQLTRNTLRDLGSLQLAFCMIWAYLSFSQFLLIWTGNIKEEVPYLKGRMYDGWQYIALFLLLGHFVLPFVFLLQAGLKRNINTLAFATGWVFLIRFVDYFWVLGPTFKNDNHTLLWIMSIVTAVGLFGIWLSFFLYQLQKLPLLPTQDYRLEEVSHHG